MLAWIGDDRNRFPTAASLQAVAGTVPITRRSGKSFSVDTLEILQQQDPAGERFFIIGLDSYCEIASWKDFARLFSLCHLVVTTRPGVVIENPLDPLPVAIRGDFCYHARTGKLLHKSGNYVFFLAQTQIDISSTQVRQLLLQAGRGMVVYQGNGAGHDVLAQFLAVLHQHLSEVISSLHVHLMHAHTMEVILVQGPARQLQRIADRMLTCRGVITGKLQLTTAIIPPLHPLPV